jgi:hypothetical protein
MSLAFASATPVPRKPFCYAGGLVGKVLQLSRAFNGLKKTEPKFFIGIAWT